jgi:hypothetical protein
MAASKREAAAAAATAPFAFLRSRASIDAARSPSLSLAYGLHSESECVLVCGSLLADGGAASGSLGRMR